MADIRQTFAHLLQDIPFELVEYFEAISEGSYANLFDVEINLLSPSEVANHSMNFHEFHPLIRELGGLVLDDANTSNHHVYVSQSPLHGSVLFLPHDGVARVVFSSLKDFLKAAQVAKQKNEWLTDFHPLLTPEAGNQEALNAFVVQLLEKGAESEVLTAIIPSLDLCNIELLTRLATADDFFLGEAVALAIEKRPSAALRPIVDLCVAHPHRQVANAGRLALRAIGGLR